MRQPIWVAFLLLSMAVISIRLSQVNIHASIDRDTHSLFVESTAVTGVTKQISTESRKRVDVSRGFSNNGKATSENRTYLWEQEKLGVSNNTMKIDFLELKSRDRHRGPHQSFENATTHSRASHSFLNEPSSPYAYVFAIWRVDPAKSTYKAYLASMLVSAHLLRKHNAQADFVGILKLAYDSHYSELPAQETDLLHRMGIRIRYLPKEDDDRHLNVYGTMFHKFTIFNLTEYKYVMYLDCDLMPMNNLDYFMEMADEGILKNNVIIASNREPSNGGLMVVRPNATSYEFIQSLVQEKGSKLGNSKLWDETKGWGHEISPPDLWETNTRQARGLKWDFWAANVDQGFIYHYCKYVLQDCTQILSRKVLNFGRSPENGTTITEHKWNVLSSKDSPFISRTQRAYSFYPGECGHMTGYSGSSKDWPGCVPPYVDFNHFTGRSKPWKQIKSLPRRKREPASSAFLWWHTLVALRDEVGLNVSSLGIPLPY